jgi:hypothetical protein
MKTPQSPTPSIKALPLQPALEKPAPKKRRRFFLFTEEVKSQEHALELQRRIGVMYMTLNRW